LPRGRRFMRPIQELPSMSAGLVERVHVPVVRAAAVRFSSDNPLLESRRENERFRPMCLRRQGMPLGKAARTGRTVCWCGVDCSTAGAEDTANRATSSVRIIRTSGGIRCRAEPPLADRNGNRVERRTASMTEETDEYPKRLVLNRNAHSFPVQLA
jgi:hypothetical protein